MNTAALNRRLKALERDIHPQPTALIIVYENSTTEAARAEYESKNGPITEGIITYLMVRYEVTKQEDVTHEIGTKS